MPGSLDAAGDEVLVRRQPGGRLELSREVVRAEAGGRRLGDDSGPAFLHGGFKKADDRVMVVSLSITQRRAAPAIHRAEVGPFGHQVLHDVRVPFRGRQVQRRSPVVIRPAQVHPLGGQLLRFGQVALARRPAQVHHPFDPRLILLQPRIALVALAVRQAVVGVKVVPRDQLLAELDAPHRVPQSVQPR